ncbi:MAG: tRNA (cytidine(34)-2'-O)-methyltransferase [Rickettsiales bacterium]
MLKIVLFEPDNPQNFGRIIRLCACIGASLHVIEPAGFPLDDARIRRGSLDYIDHLTLVKYTSWKDFLNRKTAGRILLLSTKASESLYKTRFSPDDWLLFGRETSGVPDHVHAESDLRVRIPMQNGLRSLNLSLAASMVLSEATRQILESGGNDIYLS